MWRAFACREAILKNLPLSAVTSRLTQRPGRSAARRRLLPAHNVECGRPSPALGVPARITWDR